MPLYEYICSKCGHRIEVIQRITDSPLQKCLVCGGHLKKTISPPALQFKGNGWYITDYAKKPQTEKAPDKTGVDKPKTEAAPAEKKVSSPSTEK